MLNDRELVRLALAEDIGPGDITTNAVLGGASDATATSRIVAREPGVLSGSLLVSLVFEEIDPLVSVAFKLADAARFDAGATIAEITGDPSSILTGERVALNFLSRLCGVATHASVLAALIADLEAEILDTRKTTPLLRTWEKKAVVDGGCSNHRMGLYDHVLIKDNHIAAAGGIENALDRARDRTAPVYKIEVEVEKIEDLKTAIAQGADWVLLDNMSPEDVRRAVETADGRIVLEASGGITAGNIRAYAETGVDYISMGDLTQGAKPLDMSLEFDAPTQLQE